MAGRRGHVDRWTRFLLALPLALQASRAVASNIWDGGGSREWWSDRFNWSDDQLPTGTGTLTFPLDAATEQDLFGWSSGVPNSSFSGIEFSTGFVYIAGSPSNVLGMADNGLIRGWGSVQVPLITAGSLRVDVPAGRLTTISSIVQQSGTVTDLLVGTDAAHSGTLLLYDQSYTGSTTISHGTVLLGALGFHVNTHDQGDYRIAPGASLRANGTIGLASGKRVINSGTIATSGDGPDAFVTFDGDLRMEAGATFSPGVGLTVDPSHPAIVPINVTGVMDLSATADTLSLGSLQQLPRRPTNYVLSDYGTRIGEFDSVPGLRSDMSIIYTSAPGTGPGQVVLHIVPEPRAALAMTIAASVLRRARGKPVEKGEV